MGPPRLPGEAATLARGHEPRRRSGVEAETEPVERRSHRLRRPWRRSAAAREHRVSSIAAQANGSGGNGTGFVAHHPQPGALGVDAVEQVEHHVGAEAGGADPEAGVAHGVRRASAVRRPKKAQKRVQVSIAPPHRCENRSPSSWGNVSKNWRARSSNVAGRWSYDGRTLPAEVVDRVVAAPQDPVVRGQPVVVELVGHVVEALSPAPADGRPAARASAARSSARSRRRAPCSSRTRRTSDGKALVPSATRPARTTGPSPVRTSRPAPLRDSPVTWVLLVDPHAERLRGRGQPPGQPGRIDQRGVVRLDDAGQVRR